MKIIRKSLVSVLAVLVTLLAVPVFAQEDNQIVTVDFATAGFDERLIIGPFGEETYTFSLPPTWSLIEGVSVDLDLTVFKPETQTLGGLIEISFNRTLAATIPIDWNGTRTVSIPFPEEAMPSVRTDGRHEFKVSLNTGVGCATDFQTTLIIHNTSLFTFPYETVPISTDLRGLPRPIYQPTFIPSSALIVVPDSPTAQELQAALTVAAGFGDMSSNNLLFSLIPLSQLTEETRAINHLIFVGKSTTFPLLLNLYFPMALDRSEESAANRQFTDGIVQMIPSPWSDDHVLLVVSGDSDVGVLRAAQAVSTNRLRTGEQIDATLISDVNYETANNSSALLNRTFAEAGYTTQTVSSEGRSSVLYTFYVPEGLQSGANAYLDLYFNHSTLLDYQQSGLIIRINNIPIGTASFTDITSTGATIRLPIRSSYVQPGTNTLSITAELAPRTLCLEEGSESLWVTIGAESILNVPLVPLEAPLSPVTDLRRYPAPFNSDPNLSDISFIVSPDDPGAWDVAAHIASDIGNRRTGIVTQFTAAYADSVPQRLRDENHLIVVGQPNTLAFLSELSAVLPAPFEVGNNFALENNLPVDYRLPASSTVGYLEMIVSPFNPQRAILTVLGTDAPGLQLAGLALLDSAIRPTLSGNFAVTDGTQVLVTSVLPPLITEGIPEVTAEVTLEVTAELTAEATGEAGVAGGIPTPGPEATSGSPRPSWLLPVTFGTIGLMVLTVLFVIAQGFMRGRNRRRRAAAAAASSSTQGSAPQSASSSD